MLFYLHQLTEYFGGLNVFQYVTFRAFGAAITAFLICLLLGKPVIYRLLSLKLGQPIRSQGDLNTIYERHSLKAGTPTMGGALIIFSVCVAGVLWAKPTNPYVWMALGVFTALGLLGFVDDYRKITSKRNKATGDNKGVAGVTKIVVQALLAATVTAFLVHGGTPDTRSAATSVFIPFLKTPLFADLGMWIFFFYALVLVGSSNAVNVTDGLDGLAIGCTITVASVFAIFTYVGGDSKMAAYLLVPYFPGSNELTILCMALAGAGLGFLWFNAHPAQMFMGDTGSLAIGGFLGMVAICCKQEFLLVLAGGVFVLEAGSVVLQVAGFKLTGKRILPMTPLHHTFEKMGWAETKIVARFWILSIVCAVASLATLKLR
ncbi:MAG: phospho-N-acetylmuramoyl-pentapeptide-transferase [Verrucomicrobia bacterium]|nr:phospho-N-acetylmuramoyl-pentapeptide-transferase [Verrucomicrobiota bacterium]